MHLCQLCSSRYTQELYKKHLCNQSSHYQKYEWSRMPQLQVPGPLISEVSITLFYQQFSTRYTPIWVKTYSKSTSIIKVVTMKNIQYACKGSHHMQPPNRHISMLAKMNRTRRRTLVSPWRMHCAYCGMLKGTSRTEATSNSEKNQACGVSHYWVMLV